MVPERPITPQAARAEDPATRPDRGRRMTARPAGSPPSDDSTGETWRRVLAAHVQPLPGTAD
jgi:hypothetical protein